nr:SAM-dependent methyltransferase [Candidatus Delongbacteria bacterium]
MVSHHLKSIGTILYNQSLVKLQLWPEYRSGLLHLDQFSHALIFWIDGNVVSRSEELQPAEGIDCVRSDFSVPSMLIRFNPSPIRMNVVRIDAVHSDQGMLVIRPGSVPEGALIIDLKPYFPIEDRVRDCRLPDSLSSWSSEYRDDDPVSGRYETGSDSIRSESGFEEVLRIESCGRIVKRGGACRIELMPEGTLELSDWAGFSHLQVLWWFSRFDKDIYRQATQCNPPYENAPRTGVLASRSPVRPNPVAMTTARIIAVDPARSVIDISPIDAFDGTPVLGLRPYIPALSRVNDFKIPPWIDHWSPWFEESRPSSGADPDDLSESDYARLDAWCEEVRNNPSEESRSPVILQDEAEEHDRIIISGARENNLKNISVTIPLHQITVVTGLSGSGKSSLAFDTLYAESRRRFMDTLSSSGRQIMGSFEPPAVDRIANLPPAIAIEQKTLSRNSRSTVATITDLGDFLRTLFAKIGLRHCPQCGRAVEAHSVPEILNRLYRLKPGVQFRILSGESGQVKAGFTMPNDPHEDEFRNRLDHTVREMLKHEKGALRLSLNGGESLILHTRNHCYYCGLSFFDLTPSSFNNLNPESMCPDCDGLGTRMEVSRERIVSNPEKSILDGASAWWSEMRKMLSKPTGNWMKGEVLGLAREMAVDLERPWKDLPEEFRHQALYGSGGRDVTLSYQGARGRTGDITRPVEGAVNHIRRLFRGSHGRNSHEFYLQFMEQSECPTCKGEQLNSEARRVTVAGMRFPEVCAMSIGQLDQWLEQVPVHLSAEQNQIVRDLLRSIRQKSRALVEVGLHYLSLKRPINTLSGGEAQRLRLASQLGCGLSHLLYVLDEPSVGLHVRDQQRLIRTMQRLRDKGNTLVVVEHDPGIMRQADYLIDLGPGAGTHGGRICAVGTPDEIMANPESITGRYLCRTTSMPDLHSRSQRPSSGQLKIFGASKHNLKSVQAVFPLGSLICVIGPSGSGKSSLVTQTLYPALSYYCRHRVWLRGEYDRIEGADQLDQVIAITQEAIGRTPRSNPATYTGLFDPIRNLFAATDAARHKHYSAGRFSFNSREGRCESCQGEGRKKIEMNFMPDVWITCAECHGKRYNHDTLKITYQ